MSTCNKDLISIVAGALGKFLKTLTSMGLLKSYSVEVLLKTIESCLLHQFKNCVIELMLQFKEILRLLNETQNNLSFTIEEDIIVNTSSPLFKYINEESVSECNLLETDTFHNHLQKLPEETDSMDNSGSSTILLNDNQLLEIMPIDSDLPFTDIDMASSSESYFDMSLMNIDINSDVINPLKICQSAYDAIDLEIDLNIQDKKESSFKHNTSSFIKLNSIKNKYACDMCEEKLPSIMTLQAHCKKNHDGVGCFRCQDCDKRFMMRTSYKRHLDSHLQIKPAKCRFCGKCFTRSDYLLRHERIHTGEKPYNCSNCPMKFVSKSCLVMHQKVHAPKTYVCSICSKAFARSDKLREHMRRHLSYKQHRCFVCDKEYVERRDLKVHINTIHPNAVPPE